MMAALIRRRVAVSMLFVGLTLLGIVSYRQLPWELLPSVDFPFLVIEVLSPRDQDPRELERDAIIPLEGAIGTLEDIEEIEASVDRRQGRIFVTYRPYTDIKYAYLRLQERITAARAGLDPQYQVIVNKVDTEQLSNMFMNLQARGGGGVDRVRHLVDLEVVPELEAIDGMASVMVFGGRSRSMDIILDPAALEAHGLTPSDVSASIRASNQYTAGVGTIPAGDRRLAVNVVGDYTKATDLEAVVIDPSIPLTLGDIAEVRFGVREPTTLSRVNGKESVTIQLIRDSRANLLDLADATYPIIERLNRRLAAQDMEIAIEFDSADYLKRNLDLIIDLALSGGLLAILILWFFLRNWRMVLVIAVALPISVLAAFNLFFAFDVTINSLSLVGIALAVGMLVDNSIVVLENIYRLAERGRPPMEAVLQGTREVWRSISAATLTTIVVFLPFLFAENFLVRVLGYQVGVAIVATLLISLLAALVLVPMLTAALLAGQHRLDATRAGRPLMDRYTLLLKSAMRSPLRVLGTATVLFFATLLTALFFNLRPAGDASNDAITLYMTMPAGATLATSDQAVAQLEERLADIPEADQLLSQINEEDGTVTVQLAEDFAEIGGRSIGDIREEIRSRLSGFEAAEVDFEEPRTGGGRMGDGGGGGRGGGLEAMLGLGSETETIRLRGSDLGELTRTAEDILFQLENLTSIERARIQQPDERPELHLRFDPLLLSLYGVQISDVARQLNTFQPEVSAGPQFRDGVDRYDILLRNPAFEERSVENLRELPITAPATGARVPLGELTSILYSEGTSVIQRVNQERQIEVTYRFQSTITESNTILEGARDEIDDLIAAMPIPSGVAVEVIHDPSDLDDFYFLIAVAVLLIYMLLAGVFESLVNPFIIMVTIPLAAIGSLWGIILTDHALLNANTLMGFLILLGIIVNNGILLIDYTGQLRQRGFRTQRALVAAGRSRLRPILITALTTVVALLPLAMGRMEYVTQIAAPFAITVIGGLVFGTAFTLLLIPTTYSGMESFQRWFRSLPLRIRLTQILLVAGGAALVYWQVESLVWRAANGVLVLTLVPAVTYLVRESLRRASMTRPAGGNLSIEVTYLYKIYGLPGRFRRAWQRLPAMEAEGGGRIGIALGVVWAFLIYFTYFYLDSGGWQFLWVHPVYAMTLILAHRVTARISGDGRVIRLGRRLPGLIRWGLPAVNLVLFALQWERRTWVVVVGVLWYGALGIYAAADRLQNRAINVARISGRFARIRRAFYRTIQAIPVLGRRTRPVSALGGLSLSIDQGMFGLLGPNGAGKTTLMRIICGIIEPTFGNLTINGLSARENREELQGLIGYLPQEFGTYENLTPDEYLHYQALLKGLTDPAVREARIEEVLAAVHLEERRHEKIGSFSGGMKQRIGIAQTLLHLPRILVVDEPTAGLDPRERIRFRNLLVELSQNRIVIFSTHVIEDIASACDRVAVLNRGSLEYLGTPREMTGLAADKVWEFEVDAEAFDALRTQPEVVHHYRAGDTVRVRWLGATSPRPDAVTAVPSLEDAYLWVLSRSRAEARREESQ